MFVHGKTGKVHYSINEKLKYYKQRLVTPHLTGRQREHAQMRIQELSSLKARTFDEPDLIVVDDKKLGNGISKPRLCAVVDKDDKGRVMVTPVSKRKTKTIILDNDHDRQISEKQLWLDRYEIYETKYLENVKSLTRNDKEKIKKILRKK